MIQQPFYERIEVWKDTQKTAPALKGPSSVKYAWEPDFAFERRCSGTLIAVVNENLINMGKTFIRHRPLVVNPADDGFPGGNLEGGSGAAEESLFRRSNYFRSLTMHFYPIKQTEAVYSPQITVYKQHENSNARCQAYDLDFLACPGLRFPKVDANGHLQPEDIDILEKKMELVLQVAQKNNHHVIIMSAIGCGAWKSPPSDVAATFKRILDKHDGVCKGIIFAIKKNTEKDYIVKLDDTRQDNYETFKSILSPPMPQRMAAGSE